jgi:nitrite reductase/ring-hydroxylating ferredoxin subunit
MGDAGSWTRVAGVEDVPEGTAIPIEIMGLQLALYHVGDEWFCTDNVCTHAFALLTEGWLEGHVIECPLHNGRFDVRTGKGLAAPITEDLRTFAVRLEGSEVLVALP